MSDDELEDEPRFYELAQALLRRTEKGALDWTSSGRADRFVWSGSSSSVVLETKDKDGMPPIGMRVLSSEGHELWAWISEPSSSDPIEMRWREVLHPLYTKARRSAIKVNEILDQLFEDLNVDE